MKIPRATGRPLGTVERGAGNDLDDEGGPLRLGGADGGVVELAATSLTGVFGEGLALVVDLLISFEEFGGQFA